jgi:hypothetical protein
MTICSLPADALTARLNRIREGVAARAESVEERDHGYLLRFPRDPELIRELADVVALESACCPSLSMSLASSAAGVALTIEGPAQAKALIGSALAKPANRTRTGLVAMALGAAPMLLCLAPVGLIGGAAMWLEPLGAVVFVAGALVAFGAWRRRATC